MTLKSMFRSLTLIFGLVAAVGCTKDRGELGTEKNPVKFFLVPSVDSKLLEGVGSQMKAYLEKNTPYKFSISVPNSYVAVVEAFGTKRADIASLNTFGYIMANEKYKAQARITFIRGGKDTYQSQIIARADSKVKKLEDIQGRKVAYVDPASASGYLMPAKLFADRKIKPSETVFANKHDNVVMMVYQKQVDAGATFYSPPTPEGTIEDARHLVKAQYPDIEEKVKIIELTEPIPNDPIAMRFDMDEEMKVVITDALLKFMETPEGKKSLYDGFRITGMVKSNDARYDSVREMLKTLGKDVAELSKK